MKHQDHYATLKIDRCASCEEIKQAYRRLARKFHPDVTSDKNGERKFKSVAEAYRTLKYPESRVPYDHLIKNICGDNGNSLEPDQVDLNYFNKVAAIWHFWPWFWLTHGSNGN
jgi:DnaJ-class molecular chaperone